MLVLRPYSSFVSASSKHNSVTLQIFHLSCAYLFFTQMKKNTCRLTTLPFKYNFHGYVILLF